MWLNRSVHTACKRETVADATERLLSQTTLDFDDFD